MKELYFQREPHIQPTAQCRPWKGLTLRESVFKGPLWWWCFLFFPSRASLFPKLLPAEWKEKAPCRPGPCQTPVSWGLGPAEGSGGSRTFVMRGVCEVPEPQRVWRGSPTLTSCPWDCVDVPDRGPFGCGWYSGAPCGALGWGRAVSAWAAPRQAFICC